MLPYQLFLFLVFCFWVRSFYPVAPWCRGWKHQCVQVDSSRTLVPVWGGGCWPSLGASSNALIPEAANFCGGKAIFIHRGLPIPFPTKPLQEHSLSLECPTVPGTDSQRNVKRFNPVTGIIHKIDAMPFPIKKRDYVFISANGFAADGTMFIVQRSLPHGDPSSPGYVPSHPCAPPVSDKMVRAHMYSTGFPKLVCFVRKHVSSILLVFVGQMD